VLHFHNKKIYRDKRALYSHARVKVELLSPESAYVARILAAKQDIATLMQALKLYRLDNQRYPTTEQGLQALITRPTNGPQPANWKSGGYIDRLNKDPWGNIYQYTSPGTRSEVDIFSYGADGQPGGTGNDADIGSWAD
jgi:general secretion pathway protein G